MEKIRGGKTRIWVDEKLRMSSSSWYCIAESTCFEECRGRYFRSHAHCVSRVLCVWKRGKVSRCNVAVWCHGLLLVLALGKWLGRLYGPVFLKSIKMYYFKPVCTRFCRRELIQDWSGINNTHNDRVELWIGLWVCGGDNLTRENEIRPLIQTRSPISTLTLSRPRL